MEKSLWNIYEDLLKFSEKVVYYNKKLKNDQFESVDYSDIRLYFQYGEKRECVEIPEMNDFFADTNEGKMRVKHMFSVYLLGVYCYDNIEIIKMSFDDFIKNKIWNKTNENTAGDLDMKLKNSFLYLWFLTALFHDIGYMFECRGNDDNSQYSFIIERKSMMASINLGAPAAILGIPKAIRGAAKEYFWQRRNNLLFNESPCTDHGFAGGFMLYQKLKKEHYNLKNQNKTGGRPVDDYGLIFDPLIFQWYNEPVAWAIICHNIWTAVAGSGKADKYEQLGLGKLIFPKNQSPICLKKHPLLFLLDFLDTLDPFKRFCLMKNNGGIDYDFLKNVYLVSDNASLRMKIKCCFKRENKCKICSLLCDEIGDAVSFLNSSTFFVRQEQNEIVFVFR